MRSLFQIALSEESALDFLAYGGLAAAVILTLIRSRFAALFTASGLTYLLGCGLNALVGYVNGWQFPFAHRIVAEGYVPASAHTQLAWLGDWIPIVPRLQGDIALASPGDMLVWSGELAVVYAAIISLIWAVKRLAALAVTELQ